MNRPILLHFYADWCGPCRQMERETLNSPGALEMLHTEVVAVKVNVDHHPDLRDRFRVESLPRDLFVTPEGQVLSESEGYLPTGSYLSKVAQVVRERFGCA